MARLVFLIFFTIAATQFFTMAKSSTDSMDMLALGSLYGNLGAPKQLTGWRLNGGDPCGGEQPWRGVSCDGPRVISVKIKGLGVGGYLDKDDLSAFASLKELDLSNNNIAGRFPRALPPSATHIDFSHNHFVGELGDIFTDMHALQWLDLSYNHFSGGLPVSFTSLTSLRELYLQGNQLTGSISFLANLPLIILNIENNHFGSCLDPHFRDIPYLFYDGNYFQCHESSSIALSPDISPAAPPLIAPSPTPSISHSHNISPTTPPSITPSPTPSIAPATSSTPSTAPSPTPLIAPAPSIAPSPTPLIALTPSSTPNPPQHSPARICDGNWAYFVPFCNPNVPVITPMPVPTHDENIRPPIDPPAIPPALSPTQMDTPPGNKITKVAIIVGAIFCVLLLVSFAVLIVVRVRRSKAVISVVVNRDEP